MGDIYSDADVNLLRRKVDSQIAGNLERYQEEVVALRKDMVEELKKMYDRHVELLNDIRRMQEKYDDDIRKFTLIVSDATKAVVQISTDFALLRQNIEKSYEPKLNDLHTTIFGRPGNGKGLKDRLEALEQEKQYGSKIFAGVWAVILIVVNTIIAWIVSNAHR